MADLLLEILSEEIPARMQRVAAADLKGLFTAALKDAKINFDDMQSFSTARRLSLHISGLPTEQAPLKEEKRGPQLGAPQQALEGFMKANGLKDITQAVQKEVKGKSYYFAITETEGQKLADFWHKQIPEILKSFPWPKSMRFLEEGNHTKWVRPIRNILCLFNGQVVPFTFAGCTANNQTFGHRFMAPEPFAVSDVAVYEKGLFEVMVVANRETRKVAIKKALADICTANELSLNEDEKLLEEVTGLVEWPHIILGSIDSEFMELPQEVLVDTLRDHQKYFTVNDKNGRLAPYFITLSNMVTETPEIIRAGNERVLRARLYDAKFFWDQDRKKPLITRLDDLKSMLFQAELGNQYDRSQRLSQLAADYAGAEFKEKAQRAGLLCKCDLMTGMVFEIPEVQGVMGRYYAIHDGEDKEVADAIEQHYKPSGLADDVPVAPVSVALALADKLDALVGFWAIGKKPTGSGDPFALRRSALGVMRLLSHNHLKTPLKELMDKAISNWQKSGLLSADQLVNVCDELLGFFSERLKVSLKDAGYHAQIAASLLDSEKMDKASSHFTPLLIEQRAKALQSFFDTADGHNLLAGLKRAGNIVAAEEIKSKKSFNKAVDAQLFSEQAEGELYEALKLSQNNIIPALADYNFTAAMEEVAKLRGPVDKFLDEVMVNHEDEAIRENRLNLLASLSASLNDIADFSQLLSLAK